MTSYPQLVDETPPPSNTSGRDPFANRQPPYSEDAEQAVLSAMLMDADAILSATEFVDDSMFYAEKHRRIFRAMLSLSERGDVVDPLTLSNELARKGELESSGGKDYIGFLVDVVPTSANIEYHDKIVREKAMRRRLIETSTALVGEAFDSPSPSAELLDLAEHRIFELNQARGGEGATRIKELLYPAMERIESLQNNPGALTGVTTGFKDLDELTAGFQPSDFIIVAARPSMGKTAFVLNIAQNAALDTGAGVAFFSLEMSKEQLVQRMLTSEARVNAQRLRKGRLENDEYTRLGRAAGNLALAKIWIDDTPGISVLELRSKARRLKMEQDIQMIIIDYLQLMTGPPGVENRQQEISTISRSLKSIARELKVPVVALSQLSRAPEQRASENKRPQLSDLRESGAIEQDADVVMFIYRQEYYDILNGKDPKTSGPDGTSMEGVAEIIVGKQRNGPVDTISLAFNKTYTRFDNYSNRRPQGEPQG